MTFHLSARSLAHLEGVHPALVRVVKRAITMTPVDFGVTCGRRTVEEQRRLVKAGASTTMNSRHLTGHAVDLVAYLDGEVRWDWPLYDRIATVMKMAAQEERVTIEWGGSWDTFKDGPHFQLPWRDFPKDEAWET